MLADYRDDARAEITIIAPIARAPAFARYKAFSAADAQSTKQAKNLSAA